MLSFYDACKSMHKFLQDSSYKAYLTHYLGSPRVGFIFVCEQLKKLLEDAGYKVTMPVFGLPVGCKKPFDSSSLDEEVRPLAQLSSNLDMYVMVDKYPVHLSFISVNSDIGTGSPKILITFPDIGFDSLDIDTIGGIGNSASHKRICAAHSVFSTTVGGAKDLPGASANRFLNEFASNNPYRNHVTVGGISSSTSFNIDGEEVSRKLTKVYRNTYQYIYSTWYDKGYTECSGVVEAWARLAFYTVEEIAHRIRVVKAQPSVELPASQGFNNFIALIDKLAKLAKLNVPSATEAVAHYRENGKLKELQYIFQNISGSLSYSATNDWGFEIDKGGLSMFIAQPVYDRVKDSFTFPRLIINASNPSSSEVISNFVETTIPELQELPKLTKNSVKKVMVGDKKKVAKKKAATVAQ